MPPPDNHQENELSALRRELRELKDERRLDRLTEELTSNLSDLIKREFNQQNREIRQDRENLQRQQKEVREALDRRNLELTKLIESLVKGQYRIFLALISLAGGVVGIRVFDPSAVSPFDSLVLSIVGFMFGFFAILLLATLAMGWKVTDANTKVLLFSVSLGYAAGLLYLVTTSSIYIAIIGIISLPLTYALIRLGLSVEKKVVAKTMTEAKEKAEEETEKEREKEKT